MHISLVIYFYIHTWQVILQKLKLSPVHITTVFTSSSVYLNPSSDFNTAGANAFTCKTKPDLFGGGHNNQSSCHRDSKCSFTIMWPVAIYIMSFASRSLCQQPVTTILQGEFVTAGWGFSGDHPSVPNYNIGAALSQLLPFNCSSIDFTTHISTRKSTWCILKNTAPPPSRRETLPAHRACTVYGCHT